jgi:uncharacterized damage-inducible protein DinB
MANMTESVVTIPDSLVPMARDSRHQHVVDTYVSEVNKLLGIWSQFDDTDLGFRPHPRSATVGDILKHELLSERRFFGEFLGFAEPTAAEILPAAATVAGYCMRLRELAIPRLGELAAKQDDWWQARVPFFDVERERIWIFWRRVLHTAHHRTQLTVYLRMMDKPVPSTYGPTADATWSGADPTNSVSAASRK